MMEKMTLPETLAPFLKEARRYLKKGLVKAVEFSGPTYQVLVEDETTGSEVCAFLQLERNGQIGDCFCDCGSVVEGSTCSHLCAAFLYIYSGKELPLHRRFESSIWNCLCSIYFERLGDDTTVLKRSGVNLYAYYSASGKVIFEIKGRGGKGKALLISLFEEWREPTQETSLKFSNLTFEELLQWEEGQPTPQLQYELSFWNDLAKWMMMQQERGNRYKIAFGYALSGLPNRIKIAFHELDVSFYISAANLPKIIPTLNEVKTPLSIYNAPEEEIEKVVYDKSLGALEVIPTKNVAQDAGGQSLGEHSQNQLSINGWLFVPADGFYAKDPHELLSMGAIQSNEVVNALNRYQSLFERLLEGYEIHRDPVPVSYAVAFDAQWNLSITCYLFSPGDLSEGFSRFFGEWAYIDDDGFYRLENIVFPQVETVIPASEVYHFVGQYRSFLNDYKGFSVHLTALASQLTFSLGADNTLTFSRSLPVDTIDEKSHDFGSWIYISGQGFYAKEPPPVGGALQTDLTLRLGQIPLFIKNNRRELQFVEGFFSSRSPVERAWLELLLDDNAAICITPHYDVTPNYREKKIIFFDDFTYVEGEGFCELPSEMRLPEKVRGELVIPRDEVEQFLLYELSSLAPYVGILDPRIKSPKQFHLVMSKLNSATSGEFGYSALLYYETDIGSVSIASIWQALKSKKRFFFSNAGLVDLEERRFRWLRWLHKRQIDLKSGEIYLTTLELIRLHLLEGVEVFSEGADALKMRTLIDELLSLHSPRKPDLTGLGSSLRHYQQSGVDWLWFLYQHGLSGLLCDDMGLGKTHQSMALMAAISNDFTAREHREPPKFLVVCPTSVLYHWQEKLNFYLPTLRVLLFYGSERSLENFEQHYDLILMSYGVFRLESEALSLISFELAVFDEVQIAKNHQSRIYRALQNTRAKMRLGLTGTPIENYLRELKALFDLVIPHYMPSDSDFRELFTRPIEKEQSKEQKLLLRRMIKPFVLRRKKEEVLSDLPDKIEELSHCDLAPQQRALYNEVLLTNRSRILEELRDERSPVPYLHIFTLLSCLKQICDHPAVYLKSPKQYKNYSSGKWDLFVELLSEARQSAQKVVVYSQYLAMLDIIEEYLSEKGIGYASIRGATVNRAQQLQRFSQDNSCEVFVASLQAAGLGIDLTSASVVIHYDRWWNAARENQATDRVYRIGQTKGVQVFKLVTKNSFEERINEIISRKAALMQEVVTVDDHEVIKSFTREEIINFLAESDETR